MFHARMVPNSPVMQSLVKDASSQQTLSTAHNPTVVWLSLRPRQLHPTESPRAPSLDPQDSLPTLEPMDVAASIIAILQISKEVGRVCGSYLRSYRDAPKDLRSILIEVGSVKSALEVIQLLHDQDAGTNSPLVDRIAGEGGPLIACFDILKELLSLFPRQESAAGGERKDALGPLERLRWSTKASDARRLLTDLGKLKLTLSLMLTSDAV